MWDAEFRIQIPRRYTYDRWIIAWWTPILIIHHSAQRFIIMLMWYDLKLSLFGVLKRDGLSSLLFSLREFSMNHPETQKIFFFSSPFSHDDEYNMEFQIYGACIKNTQDAFLFIPQPFTN